MNSILFDDIIPAVQYIGGLRIEPFWNLSAWKRHPFLLLRSRWTLIRQFQAIDVVPAKEVAG